ncbi:MAG: hypothetical protein H0U00_09275 [Actinobacteria bacterium]|nr:hypothetical protein [Actinomycetota bacterium]
MSRAIAVASSTPGLPTSPNFLDERRKLGHHAFRLASFRRREEVAGLDPV